MPGISLNTMGIILTHFYHHNISRLLSSFIDKEKEEQRFTKLSEVI